MAKRKILSQPSFRLGFCLVSTDNHPGSSAYTFQALRLGFRLKNFKKQLREHIPKPPGSPPTPRRDIFPLGGFRLIRLGKMTTMCICLRRRNGKGVIILGEEKVDGFLRIRGYHIEVLQGGDLHQGRLFAIMGLFLQNRNGALERINRLGVILVRRVRKSVTVKQPRNLELRKESSRTKNGCH